MWFRSTSCCTHHHCVQQDGHRGPSWPVTGESAHIVAMGVVEQLDPDARGTPGRSFSMSLYVHYHKKHASWGRGRSRRTRWPVSSDNHCCWWCGFRAQVLVFNRSLCLPTKCPGHIDYTSSKSSMHRHVRLIVTKPRIHTHRGNSCWGMSDSLRRRRNGRESGPSQMMIHYVVMVQVHDKPNFMHMCCVGEIAKCRLGAEGSWPM